MRDFFGEAIDKGISIGRDQGISIGRDQGISIGEARGITLGREQERKIIMQRLIAGGISPQQAAAFTGMDV